MVLRDRLLWAGVILLGAISFGIVALTRGEPVNAAWLVVDAVCIYFIAYRFYALFIADKVFGVDAKRLTPAYRHNDGLDYVPTNRYVLFGHHFAAIAGAGPLIGPVLAAQMGYLPGTLWILPGVVFAGALPLAILVLLLTMEAIGCGGGGYSSPPPPPPPTGTPAGAYTITVTAISGTLTHSSTLTLTVQ